MMMSKAKPEAKAEADSAAAPKKKAAAAATGDAAVADLERRLAELSSATPHIPAVVVPSGMTAAAAAGGSNAAAATMPPPAAAASAAAGNKNALLARILAAQERAKQAQAGPAMSAPPAVDLLSMDEASPPAFDFAPPPLPAFEMAAPPFEDTFGSPLAAPPAFDSSFLPPPQAQDPATFIQWEPHSSASAPAFEDLMDSHEHPPAMLPPPVPPPSFTTIEGLDEEALQAILGIDGLSSAEKQEMIDEQLKIMKSIEDSKKRSQVSAADAFEQRSFSAAVQAVGGKSNLQLHGQERTREAIADGTAVMVQCTACENWMQVTGAAQLMFCPVCQTVSPVQGSGLTNEDAQQMAADAKLAEQLQKEEYEGADRESSRNSPSRARASAAPASAAGSSSSKPAGGWMEWLGFGTPAPAPAARARGEDAPASSSELSFAQPRDSGGGDGNGLLGGGAPRRSAARVATQQPLFACVTDSISTAANYALTGSALHEDAEGNVHGVDSSSLLAVTQVGRGSSNQQYEQMPGQE